MEVEMLGIEGQKRIFDMLCRQYRYQFAKQTPAQLRSIDDQILIDEVEAEQRRFRELAKGARP